jgi:hypothetical protein
MSEALEKLKSIGREKIYLDTHIPVDQIDAILNENFEKMSRVHFTGFLSIIEREYGEDLTSLKERGIAYYKERAAEDNTIGDETLFTADSTKRNFTLIYIVIALILLVIAVFYTTRSAKETLDVAVPTTETKIVKAAKKSIHLEANSDEENTTESDLSQEKTLPSDESSADENQTIIPTVKTEMIQEEQKAPELEKAAVVHHTFSIVPRKKVWLGYIDLSSGKKYQKIFSGRLDLDGNKEWLLYFGHGYVNLELDDTLKEFHDRHKLRLLYKDGTVKKISVSEFKKLNKGKAW